MRIFILALSALSFLSLGAHARPISYAGGWTLMLMNDGQVNSAHIHYSPSVNTSLGYKFEDWRDRDFSLHAAQVNRLLKRWNKRDSQANLYFKSGFGFAKPDSSSSVGAAGFTGIAADWENRRYFIAYQNRYTDGADINGFYHQSARLGWAPYEGDYGDLHTWIMLDLKHTPEAEDELIVTPLLRLFRDIHLVEAGVSSEGDLLFNYVFRY